MAHRGGARYLTSGQAHTVTSQNNCLTTEQSPEAPADINLVLRPKVLFEKPTFGKLWFVYIKVKA